MDELIGTLAIMASYGGPAAVISQLLVGAGVGILLAMPAVWGVHALEARLTAVFNRNTNK